MWTAVMLSVDDANIHVAGEIAERLGFLVLPHFPRERVPLKEYGAALIDLDHWDAPRRDRLVEYLSRKRLPRPVALFSYHLSTKEIATLEEKGVIVGRQLEGELLEKLALAVVRPSSNGHRPVRQPTAASPRIARFPRRNEAPTLQADAS